MFVMMSERTRIFEAHRARLFGLAYRMLGSVEDAEDALQEPCCCLAGLALRRSQLPARLVVPGLHQAGRHHPDLHSGASVACALLSVGSFAARTRVRV